MTVLRRPEPAAGVAAKTARDIALSLPAAEEGPCYGTPGYRVKGKLFARFLETGDTLVVGVDRESREAFLQARPEAFFITDHYRAYDWMLVRLAAVTKAELEDLLRLAWSRKAPKRLLAAASRGRESSIRDKLPAMSKINGERARSDKNRKKKLLRRIASRALGQPAVEVKPVPRTRVKK